MGIAKYALSYGFVAALSMACSAVLFHAFPYGVITPDTLSYLDIYKGFYLWSFNFNDWARTPLYPLLLGVSLQFSQPAVAMIWWNAALFSLGIASIAWMTARLFTSLRAGVLCAVAVLLMEIFAMHTFVYSLFLLTDPVYANMLLIGSMLITGGWLRTDTVPMSAGFLILGLAALLRPVGICLFPVWGMFTLFVWLSLRKAPHPFFTAKHVTVCIVLLLLPTLFWTARNGVVYRHAHTTAFGSRNLLPHVLTLVEDSDIIFADAEQNERFIIHIRAFGEEFGTDEDVYRWGHSEAMPNIFTTLLPLTDVYQKTGGQFSGLQYVQSMFELDPIATRIAARIMMLHPWEYMMLTLRHYGFIVFSPSPVLLPDTHAWYVRHLSFYGPETMSELYAVHSAAELTGNTPLATSLLTVLHSRIVHSVRHLLTQILPWFYGVLLVLCGVLLRRTRDAFLRQTSVIMLCLLCTAFAHYVLTAMVEGGIERYALPGAVGLHLCILLCVIMAVRVCRSLIMKRLRS